MIPLFAVVRVEPKGHRPIRLWLPLFLLWLLLIVLAIILSPIIVIACLIARLNPILTVWRLIGVFVAMAGTDIEVRAPDADIVVRVL